MKSARHFDVDLVLAEYLSSQCPSFERIAETFGCSTVTVNRIVQGFASPQQRQERAALKKAKKAS